MKNARMVRSKYWTKRIFIESKIYRKQFLLHFYEIHDEMMKQREKKLYSKKDAEVVLNYFKYKCLKIDRQENSQSILNS